MKKLHIKKGDMVIVNSGEDKGKTGKVLQFMIQGGCPEGTGMGGPGYCIKGEFFFNGVKNELKHKRGVLSNPAVHGKAQILTSFKRIVHRNTAIPFVIFACKAFKHVINSGLLRFRILDR